jgi:iron complex transport system substrate-binding protein
MRSHQSEPIHPARGGAPASVGTGSARLPRRAPEGALGALRRLLLGALVPAALLLAAAAAQTPPVVDDLGRTVVVSGPALRVVSMAPSHTEVLCALGACPRLVGRDALSDAPGALAQPAFGTAFAPDLEALVAASPDLVFADEYSGLAEALAPFGIAVYAGTPQRLEELRPYLLAVGALLGLDDAAAALADDLDRGLDEVRSAVAGLTRPTVFVELDPSPYAAGPDSWIGALVTIAGGEHVLTSDLGDFPLVAPEYVVAADPEVILLLDAPYGVAAADVAARPGWSSLRAVRDGRVVELTVGEADALSRPGPRIVEAAWLLARHLHPGRF